MSSENLVSPNHAISLPSEWKLRTLIDVAKYNSEKIEILSIPLDRYISTENMYQGKGGITLASSKPKSGKATGFVKGDILFSNIRTYFKKIWLAKFDGGCSNDVLVIRSKDKILPSYLYYYLSQDKFFEYTVLGSKGTKMPRGDKAAIMRFNVALPPKSQQEKIAKTLSDIDEKIELNQQMNKTLEAIAQAIFKRWFIDFEFPNENGRPYKSSGGEMVDSEMGEIPKGWRCGKLKDIARVTSGKRPGRVVNLKDDVFLYPLIGASSVKGYVDKPLFRVPTLVIGRVGTHGIVQRFNNATFPSDNTLVILSDCFEYCYQFLNRINYDELNVGSTQPLITQTAIMGQDLIVPSKPILTEFERVANKVYDLFYHNNYSIEILTGVRDLLLPKLMTGKIRVPLEY